MKKTLIIALLVCMLSSLVIPANKASAATTIGIEYTTPIKTYAAKEDTTVWNILYVVPKNFHTENTTGVRLSDDDVELFRKYIVGDFEAMVYDFSANYMKANATIITIDELVSSDPDATIPSSQDVFNAIKNPKYIKIISGTYGDLNTYDHVFTCFAPPAGDEDDFCLSNQRFTDYHSGYSVMPIYPGMKLTEADEDSIENQFMEGNGRIHAIHSSEIMLREFLKSLNDFYATEIPETLRRRLPELDLYPIYYANKTTDYANIFYKDFMRGAVPTKINGKNYFGLKIADYKNKPSRLNPGQLAGVKVGSLDELNYVIECSNLHPSKNNTSITLTANIDAAGKKLHHFTALRGTFNGNGYAISGASLNGSGFIDTLYGKISNLLILDAIESNKIDSRRGLLCNNNYGTISSCGVTGSMSGGSSCGGIVGVNYENGLIENSFNAATVKSTSASNFGGVCGLNAGKITNCYNSGEVSSTKSLDTYGISKNGTITDCYSLTNCAAHVSKNIADKTGIVTSSKLANKTFLSTLKGFFKKGNSYPTIKNAKQSFYQCYHTKVTDKAIAGTCTTPSKSEGKHCADCGKVFVEQKIVPAKGHNYLSKFTWDSKNNCQFKLQCNKCNKILANGKCKVSAITTPSTYYEHGKKIYTARYTYNNKTYSQKKNVSIAKKALPVPKITKLEKSWSSIKVTWNRSKDATGYYLYRDNVLIYSSFTGAQTTYTDTRVVPGRKYTYKVVAISAKANTYAQSKASAAKAIKFTR